MTRLRSLINNFKLPPAGLMFQLFAIILLPLTLLLVAITFGSISLHNQAMRALVGERDHRAVSIAAGALSAQVEDRAQILANLSQVLTINSSQPEGSILSNFGPLPAGFDAGFALFDAQGNLLDVNGDAQFWNSWIEDKSNWQALYSTLVAKPGGLTVVAHPPNGEQYGLISASIKGTDLLVGGFSVHALAVATLSNLVPPGGQLSVLMVGSDQKILFSVGNFADQSASHPGVSQALQGQTGTIYVKVGKDEHVTAYAPVSAAGWALITEESWEAVVTPALRTTQIAPLVLVPAVLILLLALYLGASQVVRPLQKLESKASTLANGDFNAIQAPVGGIAEIQHLQAELVRMAGKVDEAQRSLHGYIGAITAAQEDERRRLARELHDDTLQGLIALKQRVQLAQLEPQPASATANLKSAQLDEIGSLTEQTIENLRRLTRNLRPVYLEDLGLVPALEMLARETGHAAGMAIEFHRRGTERRLERGVELAVYRIAQEACNNITRHAHAKHASMEISYSPGEVILQVQDDGSGFTLPTNPSGYAASGHYGLLGLHERAELIGASLDIQTAPGEGTHLVVSLAG